MPGLRRAAVPVLVLAGLAVAAAGTGTGGGFLVADGRRRPFRDVLPGRPLSGLRGRPPSEGDGVLARVARAVDVGFRVATGVAVIAVVAVGLWFLVRGLVRLRRLRSERSRGLVRPDEWDPGETTDDDAVEAIRRRVLRELDLLAAGLDDVPYPREVVIACYARMETLAAAAGTARRPHETPAELLARLLAEQHVPETDVRRLTGLFERARFSTHPVDDPMRAEAKAALAAVRDALGARA